jgi:hypothetical protein
VTLSGLNDADSSKGGKKCGNDMGDDERYYIGKS